MDAGTRWRSSEPMLRIRAATFEDASAIGRVQIRNGLGDLDTVARFRWWEAYPFAAEFRDIALGWGLETADGSVVGNLDNVHTLYELGGRQIKAAVAAGWAVD